MAEYRLFDGPVPHVSTAEFHAGRERAPHLEQPHHRPRMDLAAQFIREAAAGLGDGATLSDLGCGDGGLLSLVQDCAYEAWGYDFCPANAAGWPQRGVHAEALDVFGADRERVRTGSIAVMTEVLEHIADPHGTLAWLRGRSLRLVCSSPWTETDGVHIDEHAWAWDIGGYADMIKAAGWKILHHATTGNFQVVLAR